MSAFAWLRRPGRPSSPPEPSASAGRRSGPDTPDSFDPARAHGGVVASARSAVRRLRPVLAAALLVGLAGGALAQEPTPTLTLTPGTVPAASLDGATITITPQNASFLGVHQSGTENVCSGDGCNSLFDEGNFTTAGLALFTLTGAPSGLTISGVELLNRAATAVSSFPANRHRSVRITLAYSGAAITANDPVTLGVNRALLRWWDPDRVSSGIASDIPGDPVRFSGDNGQRASTVTISAEFTIQVTATDPVVTIAAGASPVTEGAAASYTLTAAPAPTSSITVRYTVADAAAPSDFVTSGNQGAKTVSMTSGTATISVPTAGGNSETTDEPNGPVTVTVNAGTGYTVGTNASAAVTVADNDATTVVLTVPDAVAAEGDADAGAELTLTLGRGLRSGEVLGVPLQFSGGTLGTDFTLALQSPAPAGVTFDADAGVVTFTGPSTGATATSADVDLIAANDADQTDRTVTVSIPAASSGTAPILAATGLGGGATGSRTGAGSIRLDDRDTLAALTEVTVPGDWTLKPADRDPGDRFRLLFKTAARRDATSVNIADYNAFVQTQAAAGHTAIRAHSAQYRTVGCTAGVSAVTNTQTSGAGTGVPIHWLNGPKAADNYTDFYDGSWDAVTVPDSRTETGVQADNFWAHTGCNHNGAISGDPLGNSPNVVYGATGNISNGPLSEGSRSRSTAGPFYALSPVYVVAMPTDGVTVSESMLALTEGHASDFEKTYTVVLISDPGATVTITVASGDDTAVAVDTNAVMGGNQSTLTFTSGDSGTWGTAQTVTVRAVEDGDVVGERNVMITHSAAVSDTSNPYHGISIDSVEVDVTDAGHGVIVSPTTLNVRQNDGEAEYTVRLRSQPGGTVTLTPASSDASHASVSGSTVSFDNTDWSTSKPVTVFGGASNSSDVGDTATITTPVTTGTTAYPTSTSVPSVTVTLTADPRPVVTVAGGDPVAEGTDAEFTVTVTPAPASGETLAVRLFSDVQTSPVADTRDRGLRTVTVDSTGTMTHTIRTVDNGDDGPNSAVAVALFGSDDYQQGDQSQAQVRVLDNDATTVTLARDGTGAISEAAATATVTVSLSRLLNENETVTVPLDVTGTGITAGDYSLALSTVSGVNEGVSLLTSTPHSAAEPAVVFAGHATDTVQIATLILTTTDDADDEGDSETLTVGFDSAANRMVTSNLDRASGTGTGGTTTAGTAVVEISDNDTTAAAEGVTVSESTLALTEGGGAAASDTYTVVLDTDPGASVTVTVASGDDTAVAVDTNSTMSGDQSTLTFTSGGSGNWATAQTVTVRAVEDGDIVGEQNVMITHSAAVSSDTNNPYHQIAIDSVEVDVTDAGHGVIVSPTALNVPENGTATYAIRLTSAPGGTVTVTPTSGDTTHATVSGAVSFTNADWSTARDVTVTAEGAATDTARITHAVTTGTTAYPTTSSIDPVDVTLTADARPVATIAAGDPVTEGTAASFTVTLNPAPATGETARVVVVPDAQGSSFAFPGASNTRTLAVGDTGTVTFTVPTVDDSTDEPNGPFTAAIADRDGYQRGDPFQATVTVIDNDATTVTLARDGTGAISEAAATATVTVALSRALGVPGGTAEAVTVPLDVTGTGITGGDYTLALSTASGLNDGVGLNTTAPHSAAEPAVVFTGHATDTVQVATLTLTSTDDSAHEGASETLTVGFDTAANRRVTSNLDIASGTGTGGTRTAGTAVVEINDNDPGVLIAPQTLSLTEGHATDSSKTYTVRLATDPGSGVTVTVTPTSGDAGAATVMPASLAFTGGGGGTWATARTVTVTAEDDSDTTNESLSVTHVATAPSGNAYNGIIVAPVAVTVTDAGHGVIVSPTTLSVRESSGTATYTIRLRTLPGGTVTVTPSSGSTSRARVSGAVSFTDADWFTPQEVTVTGLGTAGQTTQIIHAVTAGTAAYPTSTSIDRVAVTLTADTRPLVTVTGGDPVTEGTDVEFTVTVNPAPASGATLDVGLDVFFATGVANVSEVGAKTVTVGSTGTAVHAVPTIDDNDDAVNGRVGVFTSVGDAYRLSSFAPVQVTVLDNEPTAVTLARDGTGAVSEAAATATVTVTLGRALGFFAGTAETVTAPLDVTGTGITGGDYTLALATGMNVNDGVTLLTSAPHSAAEPAVVFAAHATDTVQVATLTLTATDDSDDEGTSETLTVGFDTAPNRRVTSNLDIASGTGTGGTTTAGTAVVEISDNDETADTTAPTLSTATVTDALLVLTYDEALDEDSTPAAAAFTVEVAGAARAVRTVAVSDSTVTLTLASAVTPGQTVELDYAVPNADPIQDAAGNAALALSGQAVTNNTQATPTVNLSVSASGEVTEGGSLTITATRSAANTSGAALSIPIQVKTADTTAQAADYTLPGAIAIADTETTGTATFMAVDDADDEPTETVTVEFGTLPAGTAAGTDDEVAIAIADGDATAVALARTGTGAVVRGDVIVFTVTLGRVLVAGETVDVPLSISGTDVTTADWSLAVASGGNTGVALTGQTTATPQVSFSGVGARTATLRLTAADNILADNGDSETFTVALGPDGAGTNGFDRTTLNTNVGGGADPHGTNNAFNVQVNDAPANLLTLSLSSTGADEGNSGSTDIDVTVSKPAGTIVHYELCFSGTATRDENGTMVAGEDYQVRNFGTGNPAQAVWGSGTRAGCVGSSSASMLAATTSAVWKLRVFGDATAEPDETVVVTLRESASNPLPANWGVSDANNPATYDIEDDDSTPAVSISLPDVEGVVDNAAGQQVWAESAASVDFDLAAAPAPTGSLTVCVRVTESGPAGTGDRVAAANEGIRTATLTGATGDYTLSWTNDADDTRDGVVTVAVVAPDTAGCSATNGSYTVGTDDEDAIAITDDDATTVALTSADASMSEADATDTATAAVALGRRLYAGETVTVPVALSSTTGAGLPGATREDFSVTGSGTGAALSGQAGTTPTLTFTGHDTNVVRTGTLTFTPSAGADDDLTDDTVTATLGTDAQIVAGAGLGGGAERHATNIAVDLTLVDQPVVNLSVSGGGNVTEGGTLTVTATRSKANDTGSAIVIPVRVKTADTTAQAADYTFAFTNFSIAPGATSGVRTFIASADADDAQPETVVLELHSPPAGNAVGTDGEVEITITDATATTVTLAGAAGDVTEGGTKDFTITLGRGLVNGEILPVTLTFGAGATRNVDYTLACQSSLPATVACAGLNTGTATVTFTGPSTGASATTVTLTLTAATDSTVEASGETVNIGLGTLNANSGTNLDGGAAGTDSLADFDINDPAAAAGVTVSGGPLALTEGHATDSADTYTVVLDTDPGSGVTVTVTPTSGDTGAATVMPASLAFTGGGSGSWGTARTVTVTAEEDGDIANESLNVTHAATASDTDSDYHGITPIAAVAVTVTDAGHGVIVSPTTLNVRENGGTATYTVRLESAPGGTVTVTPTSGDVTHATVSGAVSFGNADWRTPKPVTVTAAGEATDTATITHAVTAATTAYPTTMSVDSVDVTLTADARPTVSVAGGPAVAEGTDVEFTVTVNPAPSSGNTLDVVLNVSTDRGVVASGDLGAKTVTVGSTGTAVHAVPTVDDNDDDLNGQASVVVAAGDDYQVGGGLAGLAFVTVFDNDPTTVTLARDGTGAIAEASGTATVTVSLSRRLDSGETVTVPLDVTGTGITGGDYSLALATGMNVNEGVSLTTSAPHSAAEPAVVFTGDVGDVVQVATLTLTATDDADDEGTSETLTVGFDTAANRRVTSTLDRASGTGTGGTTTAGTAVVEITDNDAAADTTAPVLSTAAVNGATLTLTYDEALDANSTPANSAFTVTVAGTTVSVSGVAVSGSTVTLTLASAVAPSQTVTLGYAVPNSNPIQDDAANAALALSGQAVANNTPGLVFSPTSLTVNEGASASYTVRLASAPTGTVTVTVGGVSGELTVDTDSGTGGNQTTLTFTTAGATIWSTPQTVTVAAGQDADAADDTATLTHTAANGGYAGVTGSVAVTVDDDDPADTTAPVLSGAAVNGTSLTLTYDEALDANSTPGTSAYTVTVAGAARSVSGVAVSGQTVTLTLSSAVTASQTVTLSYAAPGSNPIQDSAGNDAANLTNQSVTNNTAAATPAAAFSSASSSADEDDGTHNVEVTLTPAPTSALTLTYSVGGSATSGTDYTALGGSVQVAASATRVDIPVAITDDSADEPAETVILTLTGGAGYTVGSPAVHTLTVNDNDDPADTTAPVLSGAAVNGTSLTLTYDEALDANSTPGTSAYTVTVAGAARSVSGVAVSGQTVTLTLSSAVTANQAVTVSYAAPGSNPVQDSAGNDAANLTNRSVTNNTAAAVPAARFAAASSSAAEDAGTRNVTVNFSTAPQSAVTLTYAVTGTATPDTDYTALSGSVAVSANAASVNIPVTILDDAADESNETVVLTLTGGAGYTVGSPAVHTLTIGDNDGSRPPGPGPGPEPDPDPRAGFASAASNETESAGAVEVAVTLDRAPAADLDLSYTIDGTAARGGTGGGSGGGSASGGGAGNADYRISGAGTLTVSAGETDAVIAITIRDDVRHEADETVVLTLEDGDGYDLGSTTTHTLTITDDDAAPTAVSLSVAPDAVAEDAGATAITVTAAVDGATRFGEEQTVTVSVTGSGAEDVVGFAPVADFALTIPIGVGSATAEFELTPVDDDIHTDDETVTVAGTLADVQIAGAEITLVNDDAQDSTAPVLTAATVDAATLTLTYDEALDADSTPAASAYTVTVDGATRAVSGVAVSGSAVTLTLSSAVTFGQTVTLDYAVPDSNPIRDAAGNAAAALTDQPVANETRDTTAPVLTAATVDGATLTLTYDEALDADSTPAAAAYTVTVAGTARAVSGVAVSGSAVTLTLSSAVTFGQAVTLDYAVPDSNPVQDPAGNDAAALTDQPVANETRDTTAPVLTAATVNGATLTLAYDEALDADSTPAAAAYTVTVAGTARAVDGVAVSGSAVTLTLSSAVTSGQAVTLDYAVPNANPIQDAAGNDAAALTGQAVANETADAALPALSIADAEAPEGGTLRFAVTLDRASARAVRASWRTSSGTALSGVDFEASEGRLSLLPGETSATVEVRALDDGHDDPDETFAVTLSMPEGATLADGAATGTIRGRDAVPGAWLGRFGRAVAQQALDGVALRVADPRLPGSERRVAGRTLLQWFGAPADCGAGPADALPADATPQPGAPGPCGDGPGVPGQSHVPGLDGMSAPGPGGIGGMVGMGAPGLGGMGVPGLGGPGMGGGMGPGGDAVTGPSAAPSGLLLGSSFTETLEEDATGGSLAFWGRAAHSWFDGLAGGVGLDGGVTSAMLGADYARGGWLAGLAAVRTWADGGYGAGASGGDIDTTLTAAVPYGSLRVNDRLSVWGAAGWGSGEARLRPDGGGRLEADVDWRMGSLGARAELPALFGGRGPSLALAGDGLWARTASEDAPGLAASVGEVARLRLALEGGWDLDLGGLGQFSPVLEVGARHDGGDAETGFGLEVGGGLAWNHAKLRLGADVRARTLLAHEDPAAESGGVSVGLVFNPDPPGGLGPSATLRRELGGAAEGGVRALLAPEGFAAPMGAASGAGRWTGEAEWGLRAFRGRFVASPSLSYGAGLGAREFGVGWRLAPAPDGGGPELSLGVQALRREGPEGADHAVRVEVRARW